MFKRWHTSGEGTGIGLYILKRSLENFGGNIKVKNNKTNEPHLRSYQEKKEPILFLNLIEDFRPFIVKHFNIS